MNSEDIILSEIIQSQKDYKGLMWRTLSSQIVDTESNTGLSRGRGNAELVFNGNRVSDRENEKVLETEGGNGCKAIWMYLMPLNCTLENG